MKSNRLILVTLLVLMGSVFSYGQKVMVDSINGTDTLGIEEIRTHSPTKATLFSTFLPGLGQAYNKKYWKIPIIYAGLGTTMYFGVTNHNSFKKFKSAYAIRIDGDVNTVDEFEGVLTEDGLLANMDYHQRNRDLSYIIAGLFYVFNIVDAAVDAHLFSFPKNDNLSFRFVPSLEFTANNDVSKGFKLVINL